MSALFRSLNSFSRKRENIVKEALINTLNENAREIEFEVKQKALERLELCEQTNALCTTLEAIFLHGLKDSFLWATIHVIAGDVERRPEPSFWSPAMVFMHKQVIEQIQTLSQITSEIGQCRAWVRQSLNESVFSAYLSNMRKNGSALGPYYKNYALLKDSEALETAAKIMESLEAYVQFDLPVNSSLLNQWSDYALQLSDLWTPALKSCPITSGLDIAGSMTVETVPIATPQPVRTNELFSESISNSPFSRSGNFGISDLSRENNDLFVQMVDEMDIITEEQKPTAEQQTADDSEPATDLATNNTQQRRKKSKDKLTRHIDEPSSSLLELSNLPHGSNSLSNLMQTSWSADIDATSDDLGASSERPFNFQRSVSMNSTASSTLRSSKTYSYHALLRKHENNRVDNAGWSEIWEKFFASTSMLNLAQRESGMSAVVTDDKSDLVSLDSRTDSEFELLTSNFSMEELQKMVAQLCQLPHEVGLNTQGFLCKSCQHPLGIGCNSYQVCAFSGYYYCSNCMDEETVLIPARIIYNWDFRKYNVSKHAATFLSEFRSQPFIDLQILNPSIYHAAEAMAELQSLRIRLNFIRAYLYTCSPASIELLQQQLEGREYLYEHIHQYSIADLGNIQRGKLCQQLQKAYKLGESHILKCPLCYLKGFICEICNTSRVLYPFHIDTTFRCETCGAVFHPKCLNEQQPCPRCKRRREREDLPLKEAVENLNLKQEANEMN